MTDEPMPPPPPLLEQGDVVTVATSNLTANALVSSGQVFIHAPDADLTDPLVQDVLADAADQVQRRLEAIARRSGAVSGRELSMQRVERRATGVPPLVTVPVPVVE